MLNLPIVVPSSTPTPGGSTTLQEAYDNSASGVLTLDSTRNGVLIQDNATPIGASVPLFAVQTTSGAVSLFSVKDPGSTAARTTVAISNNLTTIRGSSSAQTASTESLGADFDFTATRQWSTGALTTQREAVFRAPTYGFVGASVVTQAATVAITGAPIAGTNATLTETLSLWTQDGKVRHDFLDGAAAATVVPLVVAHKTSTTATAGIASAIDFQVQNGSGTLVAAVRLVGMLHTVTAGSEAGTIIFQNIQTGTLANAGHWRGTALFAVGGLGIGTVNATGSSTIQYQISNASSMWQQNNNLNTVGGHLFVGVANTSGARQFFVITPSANTASTLNTEVKKFEYSAYTHQFATGSSIGTQREVVWNAPTYAFVGASTLAVAATFAITGAPVAGTNATITKSIAFWVQGGYAQFDGRVIINAPASAPTDADLPASSISFYLDEAGNNLKVRATYADGTTRKTGTLAVA
jgi:hypothetical protein